MQMEDRKKLALELYDIGAIKFGSFRLKLHEKNPDAPLSPIYIDLRILRSFPDLMKLVVDIYLELIQDLRFDLVADVPTAATPIVALISNALQIPMISPRIDQKAYGTHNSIDGVYRAGQIALVIDDLITKADSKLNAIKNLEENGLRVVDVVVLVDREQGGNRELSDRGYSCKSAYKITELLKIYLDEGKIDEVLYKRAIDYIKS